MKRKKALYFFITLVVELMVTLILVNLVSKEKDVIDTLFLFGLGISIFGFLINPKVFDFIRPRHLSKTRNKEGYKMSGIEEEKKDILVELNVLVFGLLLIVIDILALSFNFIQKAITF